MRPSGLIFAVLMFGGGVTLMGWHTLSEVDPVAPPATARVSIGNVSLTVLASGMLEAAELISVGARVSGQIAAKEAELERAERAYKRHWSSPTELVHRYG